MSSYHFVVPQQSSSTAAAPQSPRLGRHGTQPTSSSSQWFCDPTASSSSALNNFNYLRQHSRSPRTGTPTRTATPPRTFGSSSTQQQQRHASPATPMRHGNATSNPAQLRPPSPGATYSQHRAPRASTPGGSARAAQQQQTSGGHVLRAHTPTRASTAKLSDVPLRERQSFTPTRTQQSSSSNPGGVGKQQGDNGQSPYLARLYERQLSQTRLAPGSQSSSGNHAQREQGVVQAPPALSPTQLSSGGNHQSSGSNPKAHSTMSSASLYAGIHSNQIRATTPNKAAPRSVDSYGSSVGGLTATSAGSTTSSSGHQLRAPNTPPPNSATSSGNGTPTSTTAYAQQQHQQQALYRERESQRDNRPSLHPSSMYPAATQQQSSASSTATPIKQQPGHGSQASTPTGPQQPLFYDPFGEGPMSPTTPVMPRAQLNRREATPHGTPTTPRAHRPALDLDGSQSNISPVPSSSGNFPTGGALTPLMYPSTPTNGSTPTKANSFALSGGATALFPDTAAAPTSGSGSQASTPNTKSGGSNSNNAMMKQQQQHQGFQHIPRDNWTRGPKATLRAFVNCWVNKYKENSKNYKEGGYCTVSKGERLNNGRYTLLHKLGWGEFSVVWLARDARPKKPHHTFVAVKIAKCHPSVINGTKYEINLLRYVTESPNCVGPLTELLESFEHTGNYGLHMCMVMPVMGSNLLCVIDQMKARRRVRKDKELAMIKDLTKSTLKGLDALSEINVVHTDIKPENVLVAAPDPKMVNLVASCVGQDEEHLVSSFSDGDPSHPTAVLADFGLSFLLEHPAYMPPGAERVGIKKDLDITKPGVANNRKGILIQTREYRAPEVLLGSTICPRSDVWSVGCMVYELITGDFLMDPKKKTSNEREMDIEHLAQMMHILGPVPQHIACPSSVPGSNTIPGKHLCRYFDAEGRFIHQEKVKGQPRRSIAKELEVFLEPAEAERAAMFIMSCFTYDPLERCHAKDLLNQPWLRSVVDTE